jgi:hypothetical protein
LPTLPVFGARHVARLYREHHGIHEVLGRLDERGGGVQAGDDELAGDVLHVRLHLAGDVQLVAVQGDSLVMRTENYVLNCSSQEAKKETQHKFAY